MSAQPLLWVVLPVYNEAGAIHQVVEEWMGALRTLNVPFKMMAINDGSTDDTAAILDGMSYPQLQVWHRSNVGHGPSCRFGYATALAAGAPWVLQIDSDGQCDPVFLAQFWEARAGMPVILGYRARREDGRGRWLISRMVSLEVFRQTGRWIKDANVPYRLLRADRLERVLSYVPANAFFTNILLSYLLADEIHWLPIRFRRRSTGASAIQPGALVRFARQLGSELRSLKQLKGIKHGQDL